MDWEKSTFLLSPSVRDPFFKNSEQQIPECVARLFYLVKEDKADLHSFGVELIQRFLTKDRVRLPMSEISGRRADQFSDFMAVLELRAIDFNDRPRISQQRFGSCFNYPCLAGTGRAKEQQIAYRVSWITHPGEIGLIHRDDLLDRLILPNNPAEQVRVQLHCLVTRLRRIESLIHAEHTRLSSLYFTYRPNSGRFDSD